MVISHNNISKIVLFLQHYVVFGRIAIALNSAIITIKLKCNEVSKYGIYLVIAKNV